MRYQREYIDVSFQEGATKYTAPNGCQLREVLAVCLEELNRVDLEIPCRENALVRTKLEEALHWLDHRTRDRESRGVEGYKEP